MKKTILIVDDEIELGQLIALQIKSDELMVVTVNTAEKALEYFNNNPLDLLITDGRLPGQSGIQLIEQIKQSSKGEPIFFLMTGDNNYDPNMLDQLGVKKVYSKPGDLSTMIKDSKALFL